MAQDDKSVRLSPLDRVLAYLENRLPSDKLILYVLIAVFVVSAGYALVKLNKNSIVSVPNPGGTLVEGVIGTPRFVNPVLAITRADHDLVALTYSGLMKPGATGQLENDLAEKITISDDGLVYNIVLKDGQTFHDGTTLTTKDVAFTINLIQNQELKSPLRGNWSGVTIEVIDDRELNLVLDAPYSPFAENLTVGILPAHIWSELSTEELPFSQHNTEPIGSGPYQVSEIKRGNGGLVSSYILTPYAGAYEVPKIESVVVRFFQNEEGLLEALATEEISSTAYLSDETVNNLSGEYNVVKEPLPRVFAVYFNQNKSAALRDRSARKALSVMIDRNELVSQNLDNAGIPTDTPLPSGFFELKSTSTKQANLTLSERVSEAREILFAGGWTETDQSGWEKEIDGNTANLSITIRTANSALFEKTASYLENTWRELGVEVGVELYEQSDLVQAVIRPRDYESLLFGADVGRALDLYPFWHSSEREDPGLNIALYANITTDKLLEDMRTTRDESVKSDLTTQFVNEINDDIPAIFLFSPIFNYVLQNQITIVPEKKLMRPSDRFASIIEWHMSEDRVWPIFAN